MRGKLSCVFESLIVCRITPAGAGKTISYQPMPRQSEDHPRRCGENTDSGRICCCYVGSPPQVRGKLGDKSNQSAPFGITPAGAGKTEPATVCVSFFQDHPRRCGENVSSIAALLLFRGSPPQVRGKHAFKRGFGGCNRITPAGAGKTWPTVGQCPRPKDHPRRCGENSQPRRRIRN